MPAVLSQAAFILPKKSGNHYLQMATYTKSGATFPVHSVIKELEMEGVQKPELGRPCQLQLHR